MALCILAEGDGWVVIAKPPGLAVHPNDYVRAEGAVLQRLRRQLKRWVYPIHRLDRPVSGCLMFATEQERAGELSAAFTGPEATKTYVALVRGQWVADGPIRVETPMKDDNGILKDAASTVEVLGTCPEPRCALVRVTPHTGRYHQVRRHVRDLHHPVIGDGQHGDNKVNRAWREERGVDRLALHCLSISVPLPEGRIEVVSPLFADHFAWFSALPLWDEAVARCPDLARPALGLRGFRKPRPALREEPAPTEG